MEIIMVFHNLAFACLPSNTIRLFIYRPSSHSILRLINKLIANSFCCAAFILKIEWNDSNNKGIPFRALHLTKMNFMHFTAHTIAAHTHISAIQPGSDTYLGLAYDA